MARPKNRNHAKLLLTCLILAVAALSGCNSGKPNASSPTKPSAVSYPFTGIPTNAPRDTGQAESPSPTPTPTPTPSPTPTPVVETIYGEGNLATLLNAPHTDARSKYSLKDNAGRSLDGLRIVQDPSEGFIGVYHTLIGPDKFCLRIVSSRDLHAERWTHRGDIDCDYASQGELKRLPDGRYLLGYEKNPTGRRPIMRFQLFANVAALLNNQPERDFSAPATPNANADGTPGFRWIRYDGNPDSMVVEVGFHFNRKSDGRDINAIGFLRGFRAWDYYEHNPLNNLMYQRAQWHIGDRSFIVWQGRPYTLIEGMTRRDDWNSWRLFLYDENSGSLEAINYVTPQNSPSHGNPSLTLVKTGDELRLLGTSFIFETSEGGAHLFSRIIAKGAAVAARSLEFNLSGAPFQKVYNALSMPHRIGFAEADGWAVAANSGSGHMIFGPYERSAPHAPMRAVFRYMVDNNSATDIPVVTFEVYDATRGEIIAQQTVNRRALPAPFSWGEISLAFDARYRAGNILETRVYSHGVSYIKVQNVRLHE